jgi:predicted ATPase
VAGSGLPSGTVTFLFTDVEGSTKLLHELGAEGYAEALAEHRRILRAAFGQGGGVEVDTQGDAFFVAFPTAPGALQAARAAQSELSIPVRIGVHTGTPLVTEEGYVGSDVHKAARIAAAGHGGQVLVSAATAALLDSERLRDLGEHRLKDLSAPERIYQLGDGDFPRLRTLHQTNLPVPATPFLGRQRELAEVGALLRRDGARIVTLCGPGGTGKTRLAAQAAGEAAESYPDGVFWVSLAPLRDPALVLEQAGQAVGAKNGLADHLADKRLLLLLDNFEHLIAAARDVAALLASCPNLRVLVTSREFLRIEGEQAYPVPPLAPPEAVELFTARARAADPAFTPTRAVQAICAKLDNLPLALELAAARVRVLSPQQLLQRLGGRLDLFRGGRDADPRQQTLRAMIAWSHDLLDDEERGLFARLAVFRGGCTLEAAEEVTNATVDTLQSLVDKSLLRRTNERFWMLETIRQYALERLAESGAEAELRGGHAAYFLRFAEQADRQIEDGAIISESLARVAADYDNLRSALEWARDHDEGEVLLRLAAALAGYWRLRAVYREARSWLQLALERASSPPQARIRVLRVSAMRAVDERDFARADTLLAEHRRAAEEAGDELELLRALNSAAHLAYYRGDTEAARKQWLGVKERTAEIGDRAMQAAMTVNIGLAAWGSGDYRASLEYDLEAAALFRELEDETGIAVALLNVGWSALVLGDAGLADEALREGVVVAGRLGAIHWIANGALALGAVLAAEHEEERGAQFLAAAASLREELGIRFNDAVEERIHERGVADAKAALGEEAFAAVWVRGQAMGPEEIVKLCDGRDGVDVSEQADRLIEP